MSLGGSALLRFAALQLGTRLGTDVIVVHSRKDLTDPSSRISSQVTNLAEHGRFEVHCVFRTSVGPLDITADLRARLVVCSADIDAQRKDERRRRSTGWCANSNKPTTVLGSNAT